MDIVTPAEPLGSHREHRGVTAAHGDDGSRGRIAVVGRHDAPPLGLSEILLLRSRNRDVRIPRAPREATTAGSGMFGSPRSPAAPWYGYSHDLDAAHVPSPYASSRSPTHSPAGDPTLELEIATSFNTVLNKVRDLKTDAAKPLRSPKRESPGKAPASPSSSDARMKRMEKMERRLTWVLENGMEQDGSGGQSDGGMGASSESDLTTSAPSSASNSLAADAPMPEASKMLARRELERLIAERDEAVAALAKERTGSGRSPSEELARCRSENRRLATENAELRAHLGHSRGRNGANTQGGGTSDLTAQKGEARELKRLADELQASMARSDRLERALHDIVSKTSAATETLVSSQGGSIRSGSSPGKPGMTAMNEVPASPSRMANDEACDLSGARPGPDFHDVEPKRLVSG